MFNSGSDPFVNSLKSFGYNMVRLPKPDMAPLQLLTRTGDNLDRLGPLTSLFVTPAGVVVPPVTSGTPVAPISGSRTSDLKIGVGLSILGTIIGAMGGSTLGLNVAYNAATSASFEFSDVTEDRCDVIDLDKYLGGADISPASVFVSKLLDADQVYVLTSVIKSAKFTFDAKGNSGVTLKLDVPVIQGAVGGNVSVSNTTGSTSKIVYEGKIPLAFGFQAIQLFFENGRYTAFKPAAGVAAAVAAGAAVVDPRVDLFRSEQGLLRVRD
jgi:hypothetical protein